MTCTTTGGSSLRGCDVWAAGAASGVRPAEPWSKGGRGVVASMAEAGGGQADTGVWALAPNGKTGKTAAALQLAAPTGLGTAENGLKTPLADGDQALKLKGELLLRDAEASAAGVVYSRCVTWRSFRQEETDACLLQPKIACAD